MLSQTENETLTRVGPGTPLGKLLRRYWHPIALSSQADADGAPLRTKLLGQRFVVFRDTAGKAGILNESCMHRGVSLALGRNEDGGLRCLYHGWKFAVDGTILETPNHADCRFRERMKAPAYPVREDGGLIWTYIGPKELEPPFRRFGFDLFPEENRFAYRMNTKASWLSMYEGGLDSSHVSILHTNVLRPSWAAARGVAPSEDNPLADHLATFEIEEPPCIEVEDTEYGFNYSAIRDLGDGLRNVRVAPVILPYGRMVPTHGERRWSFEVPMDDFETASFSVAYTDKPVDSEARSKMIGHAPPLFDPETGDVHVSWANNMGQDRSRMGTDWSGIPGVLMEDAAMSVSLGEDWDRSDEHVVPSDMAIVRMRRRMLDAIQGHQAGEAPPGVFCADLSHVEGFDRTIAIGDRWQDMTPSNSSDQSMVKGELQSSSAHTRQ